MDSSCLEEETEDHSSSQLEIPQVDTIKVSKTVEEDLAFDMENENDLWWKATEGNECSKTSIQDPYEDARPPIGSQYMKCHMVKMEDFS